MSWATLIPIIVQYGLPVAEAIFKKWNAGTVPTQADFDELRLLAGQTAIDRVKLALATAGIAEDSEQGKTLLALAQ
jgi:hypothetical protein